MSVNPKKNEGSEKLKIGTVIKKQNRSIDSVFFMCLYSDYLFCLAGSQRKHYENQPVLSGLKWGYQYHRVHNCCIPVDYNVKSAPFVPGLNLYLPEDSGFVYTFAILSQSITKCIN